MNRNTKNIETVDCITAIRLRPEMYIGSTDKKGFHELIRMALDNSIYEAKSGFCQNIHVTIHDDKSISIEDDGRGVPSSKDLEANKKSLEKILTIFLVGLKFGQRSNKPYGLDFPVLNALSSKLIATVYCDGKIYEQTYKKGQPKSEVRIIGETNKHGTKIHFYPDASIFENPVYDSDAIKDYMQQQTAGLSMNIECNDKSVG